MKTLVRLQRSLSFLFLLIVIPGCVSPGQTDQDKDRLRFIFITTVVGEDFFIPVKKGMEDAARLMGVSCTFTGTEGVDVPAQAGMVRRAIREGYDGIALNIIDPEGFDAVVTEAIEAGIPVVAFNTDDHATPNKRLSSVCQDLYEAGRILGMEAAKFIPDECEILMTMHDEGISALEDRLQGIRDGLNESGKNNIRHSIVITGSTVTGSAEVISRELKAHPQIRHVLCTGQADTEGAGIAIAENFSGQGHKAAGFDVSPGILHHISQGQIVFTIDQQPYIQGFYPVIQLTLLKRYGIMPSDIDAGANLITVKNADSVLVLSEKHHR